MKIGIVRQDEINHAIEESAIRRCREDNPKAWEEWQQWQQVTYRPMVPLVWEYYLEDYKTKASRNYRSTILPAVCKSSGVDVAFKMDSVLFLDQEDAFDITKPMVDEIKKDEFKM